MALARPTYHSSVVWPEKENSLRAYLRGSDAHTQDNSQLKQEVMRELDDFEQHLRKVDNRYSKLCTMLSTPAPLVFRNPDKVLSCDDPWLETPRPYTKLHVR